MHEGSGLTDMYGIPLFGNYEMDIFVNGGLANYRLYTYNAQGLAVTVPAKNVKAAYEGKASKAATAFGVIMGATAFEDILTSGLGTADDLFSFIAALNAATAAFAH